MLVGDAAGSAAPAAVRSAVRRWRRRRIPVEARHRRPGVVHVERGDRVRRIGGIGRRGARLVSPDDEPVTALVHHCICGHPSDGSSSRACARSRPRSRVSRARTSRRSRPAGDRSAPTEDRPAGCTRMPAHRVIPLVGVGAVLRLNPCADRAQHHLRAGGAAIDVGVLLVVGDVQQLVNRHGAARSQRSVTTTSPAR